MKILLTGASGLVGGVVAESAARQGHTVIGIVSSFAGPLGGLSERRIVELSNPETAFAATLAAQPDAIINCAAVSEVAQVDADPARSQALNVGLPAALARAAQQLGARLIHLSSEQAFDGERTTPYKATDPVSPINLYGRQKIESEQTISSLAPAYAVTVRAPLLMGNSPAGKRSGHERMLHDWAAGKTAKLYRDELRQPCSAENLAEVLVELCTIREPVGVVHWAGAELIDRHTLGLRVREHFRLSEKHAPIVALARAETPEASKKRQACLALDISPLARVLKTQPETIAGQVALSRVPPALQAWYASTQ